VSTKNVSDRLDGQKIRIYDNFGKTADRYTVVYMGCPERRHRMFESVGMDSTPFHPMGICQHGPATPGRHLGRRIKFEDLPKDCQKVVRRDLEPNDAAGTLSQGPGIDVVAK